MKTALATDGNLISLTSVRRGQRKSASAQIRLSKTRRLSRNEHGLTRSRRSSRTGDRKH